MATQYTDIYDCFLGKISDYDFVQLDDFTQFTILGGYLKSAIADFEDTCKKDLEDRNDILAQFNVDLSAKEIEILATGMVVHWLEPRVLNTENLRNVLNTKDYSSFSPANLLEQMQTLLSTMKKHYRYMLVRYGYRNADLRTMSDE